MTDVFLFSADRHRPYLMTRVQGTNDYINAVFLDVSWTFWLYFWTQDFITQFEKLDF